MNKYFVVLFVAFTLSLNLIAQTNKLYMPLDVKSSYEKNIRSYDGKPGSNYWVNSSDYKMKINFDPKDRVVKGKETITYFNNSPDSLSQLVFRLYQDIYKKGNSRDWPINPVALSDGMEITKIIVDGTDLTKEYNTSEIFKSGTNLYVKLKNKIIPKSKSIIEIDWNFTIPEKSGIRMGMYDSTSFLIAYFYPQVAVYDDIDGWDTFDYGGTQEFYNDICNYDVEITVPKNIIVWGTGVLQNANSIFSEVVLNKFNKAKQSEEVIHIIDSNDVKGKNLTKGEENTYKFIADEVPDFVFALSDHYLWDGLNVITDGKKNKSAFVQTAYKPDNKGFIKVAEISKKSIEFFSNTLPGVPYPYPSMTVFNGGGGMEYPMMVNESVSIEDWIGNVYVTSHEILHTYFPFYMGINERKYAWMDEGMAVMLPFQIQKELTENYESEVRNIQGYEKGAGKEIETPLMILTSNLKSKTYRFHAYVRSATAYSMLEDLIGEDNFKKCMKEYINRWNGKHPIPYDFFYTFEDVLKEDLTWFWKPWFFESGYPDLAIKKVEQKGKEIELTIEKVGNMPTAVNLLLTSNNGYEVNVYESAKVWRTGNNIYTMKIKVENKIDKIELGNKYTPDVDKSNNVYKFK